MEIVLYPGDDDVTGPKAVWPRARFLAFRRWLAQAEGFVLDEMDGFGGQRPWSDVSTPLAPFLDHPDDDGPDLTPPQCAAVQARLAEIADRWSEGGDDPVVRRHIDDARQLVVVLRCCVEKDVDLFFY
ncbi:hypothetical protein [Streptomyces geranii]|uniref:hypothetical protein n=1 Tax=Streptomyces geranii TaxID=2058923 RepID=UPI000D02C9B8|nr:hypothetical protein [Streptomyces geranii]